MAEKRIVCKHCRSQLREPGASVCAVCGRDQLWVWSYFTAINLISLGLLILASMQFIEARQERIKAEDVSNRVIQMEGDFKRVVKGFVENNLISSKVRLTFGEGDSNRLRLFDDNVDELAKFIEPNDRDRKSVV